MPVDQDLLHSFISAPGRSPAPALVAAGGEDEHDHAIKSEDAKAETTRFEDTQTSARTHLVECTVNSHALLDTNFAQGGGPFNNTNGILATDLVGAIFSQYGSMLLPFVGARPHVPRVEEGDGGRQDALHGAVGARVDTTSTPTGIDGTRTNSGPLWEMDHICWRCASEEEYRKINAVLRAQFANHAHLLLESMIGGRPIATWKLREPLVFNVIAVERSSCSGRLEVSLPCSVLEIPCPKRAGGGKNGTKLFGKTMLKGNNSSCEQDLLQPVQPVKQYPSGWEHVEFAVGENKFTKEFLVDQWELPKKTTNWNCDALGKDCNPDVSLDFEFSAKGRTSSTTAAEQDLLANGKRRGSFKIHELPLEKVIEIEIRDGHVVPVPESYFAS
ncbi:unnamed protein product [Amoebophrya sp. A120]|nr:unnamed protein product [Amoebophrya sp. A120]|eukprot:GSA120T00022859001.1